MTVRTKKNSFNITQWILLMMATGVLYYGLYDLHERLLFILFDVWSKVGVVMIALLPLTVLLAAVPFYLLLNKDGEHRIVIKLLQIISFAAPSLGLLGTVLGTVDGTAAFSMAKGVEQLLKSVVELQKGLSIALLSTAWGVILSIPSGIMLIWLAKEDSVSEQQEPSKISSVSKMESQEDKDCPQKPEEPILEARTRHPSENEVFQPQVSSQQGVKDVSVKEEKKTAITNQDVINTLSSLGIKGVQPINKEVS